MSFYTSAQTHHYFGFSLTDHYNRIQEIFDQTEDPIDLGGFLLKNNLGGNRYSSGWGQVTFIGRDVPMTDRGILVTDEIEAEVKSLIANLPERLHAAIVEVMGAIPEPKFGYEQTEG
jgi:alkaline phosphatase